MFGKLSFEFANVKWDVPGCFWDGEHCFPCGVV